MNIIYQILTALKATMVRPEPYGWFHLLFVGTAILSVVILCAAKKISIEKKVKYTLLIYAVVALLLELTKQIIWSFEYTDTGAVWDYQWYAAPFQLCTTPIFACFTALLVKNNTICSSMLSYMAYFTVIGSIATMVMPDSCFVETIEVNIHTMWLHCGSFAVSAYLLLSNTVKVKFKELLHGFYAFLFFAAVADILNILVYNTVLPEGETFNMFYISPYFISSLPVFCDIQQSVPYPVYLLIYVFAISLGGLAIYGISYAVKAIFARVSNTKIK